MRGLLFVCVCLLLAGCGPRPRLPEFEGHRWHCVPFSPFADCTLYNSDGEKVATLIGTLWGETDAQICYKSCRYFESNALALKELQKEFGQ